jgi:hypothetical protein
MFGEEFNKFGNESKNVVHF